MPRAVERWIVCFSGFLQEGRLSGIEKIEDAIHRQCNGDSTRVLLKSWRDSPADVAQRIWNRCPEGHQPAVVIIGYSYGGYTAVLLARELEKRGLKVETMLLIDPVWRWAARWPSLLSWLEGWEIKVPSNVRKLYGWTQKVDTPAGHKIVPSGSTISDIQTLMRAHNIMDDAMEVYNRAMFVACPESRSV